MEAPAALAPAPTPAVASIPVASPPPSPCSSLRCGSEHVLGVLRPGRSVGLCTGGPHLPVAVDDRFAPAESQPLVSEHQSSEPPTGRQPEQRAASRPSISSKHSKASDLQASLQAPAPLVARPASDRHIRCMRETSPPSNKTNSRPRSAGRSKRAKSK